VDFDLIFVTGLVIVVFGIPMLVGAYVDRRFPRKALLMFVLGGGALLYAMQENPGGYTLGTLDDVIVAVIGRYLG
jgi:hypothetical protein